MCLFCLQHLIQRIGKIECPCRGYGFGILDNFVLTRLGACSINGNSVVLEVDVLPTQAAQFAAAQTEIGTDVNRQFKTGARSQRQQLPELFGRIIFCLAPSFLGWGNCIHWVFRNILVPLGSVQDIGQQVVMLEHRVRRKFGLVQQMGIVQLDMTRRQLLQLAVAKLWL